MSALGPGSWSRLSREWGRPWAVAAGSGCLWWLSDTGALWALVRDGALALHLGSSQNGLSTQAEALALQQVRVPGLQVGEVPLRKEPCTVTSARANQVWGGALKRSQTC